MSGNIDYVTNPNLLTPCVLVLDASSSMSHLAEGGVTRIDALNEGVLSLADSLQADSTALTRRA
jgi:uncharacterized protein YegL